MLDATLRFCARLASRRPLTILVIGVLLYLFYGYRNSRLAQGLDCVDDSPLPSPNEAIAHGLDERR